MYLFETTTARIRSGWFVLCLFFFWGGGAVVNRFVMYFFEVRSLFRTRKGEQARGYPTLLLTVKPTPDERTLQARRTCRDALCHQTLKKLVKRYVG